MTTPILLTSLNARYAHSALGLRYLYANLKELQPQAGIVEFTINESIQSVAERILEHSPRIIGIGVYIWNALETAELIEILKKVSPSTTIVLGGPEAGYLPHRVDFSLADYVISGEGEIAFYELCRSLLQNDGGAKPHSSALTLNSLRQSAHVQSTALETEQSDSGFPRFIKAPLPNLGELILPYAAYSDEDIAHRYLYVEASRGCPFECEFCLSSIDEKVRNFPLESLLKDFETLWERGARNFKFIDRTFNLNMTFANRILDFFLSKDPPYFAHFEVIPDHFPDSIKEKISRFPAGALQLEIGIQTLNPEVAKRINRPLRLEKIVQNIRYLQNETDAHMHLDLIVGLPGETLEGFGRNLDTLVSIAECEIQIGILKKLSGTTLSRHDREFGMVYSDTPPYDILQNDLLSFSVIQKMKRFARFWDMYYNSGNFDRSVRLLWPKGNVFETFYAFSEWIYDQTLSTWKISLDRQTALLYEYLRLQTATDEIHAAMMYDIGKTPGRTIPKFLNQQSFREEKKDPSSPVIPKRQSKRITP